MKKSSPSKFDNPCSLFCGSASINKKRGFTLIEVILVVVIALIMLGVSLPHFAQTFKGSKLRSAARTINRMGRYGRSMAILREHTMTMVLNTETMEIYLGGPAQASTNTADGELDQAVLKRLGYVDGEVTPESLGIEREVFRFLPDDLVVTEFEKEWAEGEFDSDAFYIVNYYSDGLSDWFLMELESRRGMGVRLENDPISGKIRSEFTQ
jgi:prepilin-type N-terminal cleavage/methylation domain-containing protein